MHKIVNSLLALLALTTFSLSAAEFKLPAYEKLVLENGLTLYLMEQKEVPLIDAIVTVKAGAVQDEKAGQAEMTANALLLGSGELSRAEFEQHLDFVGANINAGGGMEASQVAASFASKDEDKVLKMLADALLHPVFDEQEIRAYQQRHLAALQQAQESPKAVIGNYFNALLFAEHPYATEQSGNIASVKTMQVTDLKGFYDKWYRPDNTAISIVGDFDSDKMISKIKALFGQWQGQTEDFVLPLAEVKADKARVLLVDKPDARESTYIIGGPGIARSNPDYVALQVINTILGGRFTSWLNDELRVNTGLTYGARSSFQPYQKGGSFSIYTFTQTDKTKEAIDLTLKTYARLWQQGIDKETLDSAKAYVKGQFPPKYETSGELAGLLSGMFIYGYDEAFINDFSDNVNALDVDKAKSLVGQYFPQQHLQMVVVGNAEALRPVVSEYGELIETKIDTQQISL
ncbi:M16 family metallopeptidase [Lacimicrobium alkaliphilum]|uniref:Peptidase M16 n=1 Tax=Lacimicrobium alkaliphilum TaxID=1526571 RepID=A0A0U3BCD8_9ALTE|nr:pitrilysin family protein [Lacimicrobium alkaliphilum]ALS99333.1 peptidase M16 [Lacimicrobium alkaliphilum]